MAPEVFEQSSYDYKVDIWGLGVVLYEMLHGDPPDPYQFTLRKQKLTFNENLSSEVKELIDKLLRFNPSERIDLKEIFRSSWVVKNANTYKWNIDDFFPKIPEKKTNDIEDQSSSNEKKKKDRFKAELIILQKEKKINIQKQFEQLQEQNKV